MKKILKPFPLLFILIILSVIGISIAVTSKASATTRTCYFSNGSCYHADPPPFSADILSGRTTQTGGAIPSSINIGGVNYNARTKAGFIKYIKNRLNTGGQRDHLGAAFIINKMIRAGASGVPYGKTRNPGAPMVTYWEGLINNPAVSIGTANLDLERTSFYDPNAAGGNGDDFFDPQYNSYNRDVLYFMLNGERIITIELACGNFADGPGFPPINKATLDGVKIDNSNDGSKFGGSALGSYYNDNVTVGGEGSDTGNPFYFDSIEAGWHTVTVTDDSDTWDVIGYSICSGGGCTSAWLSNPANRSGGTSFSFYFQPGVSYHMRWINARVPPIGSFDGLSCTVSGGWAFDPSISGASINVDVYVNGVGTRLTANGVRGDVNAAYGIGGNHGYSFDSSTMPGFSYTGVNTVQIFAIGINRSGVQDGINANLGVRTVGPCIAASCGATSPSAASVVQAGGSVTGTALFNNTGGLPWNYGGRVTARSTGAGYSSAGIGVANNIGPGGNTTVTYGPFGVPATLNTQTITMQLVFDGGTVIASCPASFDPYMTFNIDPIANSPVLTPDAENPNSASFTGLTNTTFQFNWPGVTPNGQYTTNRTMVKNGVNTFYNSSGPPTSSAGNTNNYNSGPVATPAPNAFGDSYCSKVVVSIGNGLINKNNTIANAGPSKASPTPCTYTSNKPYYRVYGGDIFAGGSFKSGGTCANATGGNLIGQYRTGTGGAGTQLAAIALIKISGVASATMRTSFPTEPNDLTFANDNVLVSVPDTMGGSFGAGQQQCSPDYFTEEQYSDARKVTSASTSFDANSLANGGQTLINPGATRVKVSGSNVTARHTIFVNGDVEITDNIVYAAIGGTDPAALPYLTIIAKGNIYIDPNVTRIDGLYIAQANAANTGRIYTCNALSGMAMVAACTNQLVVNGSFIAQRVVLQRAKGTLRDSSSNGGVHEPANSPNIAEVFQFSPDLYVGQPAFQPKNGEYDSIKGLPPVL